MTNTLPSPAEPLRIAMWSGPRNISTAMMRAWENRADAYVCDEPLYAHYLQTTGLPHPGAEEVVAEHETDWRTVADWLTGPVPQGRSIFYQKHMAHHLLAGLEGEWLNQLTHCFLIREPREMITSLVHFIPRPTLQDTGLPQQWRIFQVARERQGRAPLVLDARDVLTNPAAMLRAMCERLGVPFDQAMLSWPNGRRETDGVWAKHWYSAVEKTTSFGPYRPKADTPPDHTLAVLQQCEEIYHELHQQRLTV